MGLVLAMPELSQLTVCELIKAVLTAIYTPAHGLCVDNVVLVCQGVLQL